LGRKSRRSSADRGVSRGSRRRRGEGNGGCGGRGGLIIAIVVVVVIVIFVVVAPTSSSSPRTFSGCRGGGVESVRGSGGGQRVERR